MYINYPVCQKIKIIGTGTALDSARLKKVLAEIINVDINSVHAYSIGEHGDSQIIPWSLVSIGGKPLIQLFEENEARYGAINLSAIKNSVIQSGWKIADVKGTTNFGISATAVEIIKAIVYNENVIIPVSTLLDGEYDEYDVFTGIPAVINVNGVHEILKIDINDEELQGFKRSVQVIRQTANKVNNKYCCGQAFL